MTTSDAATQNDAIELLLEELLTNVDRKNLKRILTDMYADDPDTLALAHRLITTGSDSARRIAHKYLDDAIYKIANAQMYFNQEEGGWKSHCKNALSPQIKHRLLSVWNLAELAEETHPLNTATVIDELKDVALQIHIAFGLATKTTNNDYSKDEGYWRGSAALVLTGVTDKIEEYEDHSEFYHVFIEYAGHAPNAVEIIHLATERNSVNPDLIKAILQEQGKVPTGLRVGVL